MKYSDFLLKLSNPQVYTGKEINAIYKTGTRPAINICLVFPDIYEIGMSHYGIQILYQILNNMDFVRAERCFMPDKKSLHVFEEYDYPLFSLESKKPLLEFDIIAFSLLSELNFTNVIKILSLAHIPRHSNQRLSHHPIIAAGGISAINPEPLRSFIDFFAFGDGEVIFPDIICELFKAKKEKTERSHILQKFSDINGIYVPSLFPVQLQGRFFLPQVRGKRFIKRVVNSLDEYDYDQTAVVPITDAIFNRLTVEIARGCPQNCRFCQAKSYYSPYRIKSPQKLISTIKEALTKTGFETLSLSSLSSGDYPFLTELLQKIPSILPPCTSFSVPSLRPSTLSEGLLKTMMMFRRTGLTIVPEAGSQRLRQVINKNVTDEEIFSAVDLALEFNWQKLKLYFMIGLPSETIEDIKAMVSLIESIITLIKTRRKNVQLHLSFSTFVPKSHTVLQWAPRPSLVELQNKIQFLKQHLKRHRFLILDFHHPQKGILETVLSRGDARVGTLLEQAVEQGEIFSAWDAEYNFSVWQELIDKLDLSLFLAPISLDEPLPWNFLDICYHPDYLKKEYQNSLLAVSTPTCFERECKKCRGCHFPYKKKSVSDMSLKPIDTHKKDDKKDLIRFRLFYEKKGDFRFFSHLSIMKYIERLIRKTGIVFKYSTGFHPRMLMTFLPPLPVLAQSRAEVVELFLDAGLTDDEIMKKLNSVSLSFNFNRLLRCENTAKLAKDLFMVTYEWNVEFSAADIDQVKQYLGENESIEIKDVALVIQLDYSRQGEKRFSQIYKSLDPERHHTEKLFRTQVLFYSDKKRFFSST